MASTESLETVHRLCAAVNAHDLDKLVDCFTASYRNETPAHPGRSFTGTSQVRRNWERIFAGLPDIAARLVDTIEDGDTVWSEWEMSGTRPDGTPEVLRGVIIFGTTAGRLSWARFYLEQVDASNGGHDDAVGRLINDQAVGSAS